MRLHQNVAMVLFLCSLLSTILYTNASIKVPFNKLNKAQHTDAYNYGEPRAEISVIEIMVKECFCDGPIVPFHCIDACSEKQNKNE